MRRLAKAENNDENTLDLSSIRKRIDAVDEQIQTLINERARYAQKVGISKAGIELVTQCLEPEPEDRPASMDAILEHASWKEIRKSSSSDKSQRRGRERQRLLV